MEDFDSGALGVAVDEDEELLADKQQGTSTGGSGGDDLPTENVTLNL